MVKSCQLPTLWQKNCWINQENPCSWCRTARYLLNDWGRQNMCPTGWVDKLQLTSMKWFSLVCSYGERKNAHSINLSLYVSTFFLPECILIHWGYTTKTDLMDDFDTPLCILFKNFQEKCTCKSDSLHSQSHISKKDKGKCHHKLICQLSNIEVENQTIFLSESFYYKSSH